MQALLIFSYFVGLSAQHTVQMMLSQFLNISNIRQVAIVAIVIQAIAN